MGALTEIIPKRFHDPEFLSGRKRPQFFSRHVQTSVQGKSSSDKKPMGRGGRRVGGTRPTEGCRRLGRLGLAKLAVQASGVTPKTRSKWAAHSPAFAPGIGLNPTVTASRSCLVFNSRQIGSFSLPGCP